MSVTAQHVVYEAVASVERAQALDGPAQAAGQAVRGAIRQGAPKEALSGTWLGHALHPLLTDAVIGTWTSALLLDVAGGRESRRASERLIAAGIASSLPTALTGANDWADTEAVDPGVRRVGMVHGLVNVAALGLQVASLRARRRGAHGRGVALSALAGGALAVSGHLGGHLSYVQGVGVNETTFDAGPEEWTALVVDRSPDEGAAVRALAGDTPVLLTRRDGRLLALHDRCAHRGCSLADGRLDGDVVECACHGSRYALADGELRRGPATVPQPAFEVRERDGHLEVRRR
ncbi:MAG TPA: Rieske 2Fe-2S domain-containing protein [Baekduia sp.]|nr:Rieske 2Fe-2S domain-containing protein [Baekduia sp.]